MLNKNKHSHAECEQRARSVRSDEKHLLKWQIFFWTNKRDSKRFVFCLHYQPKTLKFSPVYVSTSLKTTLHLVFPGCASVCEAVYLSFQFSTERKFLIR